MEAHDAGVSEVEPLGYYLVLECRRCDAEMYYGVCVTLLGHNGLPVVPAGNAEQTRFDCTRCGARNYVGDLDVLVEGGNDHDSDDDDDSDDEDEDSRDVLAAFEAGAPVVIRPPERGEVA